MERTVASVAQDLRKQRVCPHGRILLRGSTIAVSIVTYFGGAFEQPLG